MARGQNIIQKVFNKPQLITLEALQPIVDYLADPQRSTNLKLSKDEVVEQKVLARSDFEREEEYRNYKLQRIGINPETMVGTLHIKDTLVNREGQLNANCMELTSYEALKKTFKAQVDEGVKSCVLMVDSSGGEAYGCFETANAVKKLAKDNGVKLTAYIDGLSASAAFAWTVIADEVIANPMSQVGSVGVVVQLYNNSKMLEDMGIERSFVYAGGNKIPFAKDGSFSENFINSLQESVNKSYDKFVSHVSKHLELSEETVRNTQASVFDADVALEIGFVDKLMEVDEFQNYVSSMSTTNTVYFNNQVETKTTLEKEKTIMTDVSVEQLQAQLTSALEEKQTLQDTLSGVQAQLSELTEAKESLEADLASLKQAKEALELEKAQQEADAIIAKRTAKLEDALGKGNEKVATLLASTATLSEEHFEVIASSLKVEQEAKQEQFQELGGEGQESEKQLSLSEMIAKRAKAKLEQNKTA